MQQNRFLPATLALALAFVLALLGYALYARPQSAPIAAQPEPQHAPTAAAVDVPVQLEAPRATQPSGPFTSSVIWPLRIELQLLQAGELPQAAGFGAVAADRSARFQGRIADGGDAGVRASVRFSAGPNAGRVLDCDRDGNFGATDLYPGLNIVEVEGPGILGSRREVLLRQGSEAVLNIGYGRLASAWGQVVDREGKGIEGASVLLDGQGALSDGDGYFYVPAAASGESLIEIDKPGYAALREKVGLTAGQETPRGRLSFTLRPPGKIQISIQNDVGAPQPVSVYLLPADMREQRQFPWYKRNPIEVWPGRPVVVEDLPQGVFSVRAFRPGARAPQARNVSLRSEELEIVELVLEPAPLLSGRVLYRGEGFGGAKVRLEALDRVNATLAYFRKNSFFLETEVMPHFEPAMQEAVSEQDGRFVLSAWSDIAPQRLLQATSADGRLHAARFVDAKTQTVELELQSTEREGGELVVDLPGRHQGLAVEVVVNGAPRDLELLAPERELIVPRLAEGLWSLRASWHGDPLREMSELELRGSRRIELELPPEALEGQNDEAWRRSGRTRW